MNRHAAYLAATLGITFALPAPAQENWTLLPEEAACILENIDAYIAEAAGKPAVIFVKFCPTASASEVMAEMQTNSGVLPNVTVQPGVTEDAAATVLDDVIVYSVAELECLADLEPDLEAEIVQLPQRPCDP